MKRVRVLVAHRPRLMRETVLAVVSDQPDIDVIGEVQDESRLVELVEEARPDALILSLENADKCIASVAFCSASTRKENAIVPRQGAASNCRLVLNNVPSSLERSGIASLLQRVKERALP